MHNKTNKLTQHLKFPTKVLTILPLTISHSLSDTSDNSFHEVLCHSKKEQKKQSFSPQILCQYFFPFFYPSFHEQLKNFFFFKRPTFCELLIFLAVTDQFLNSCKKTQLTWSQRWGFSPPWVRYMTLELFVMEIILHIKAQTFRKLWVLSQGWEDIWNCQLVYCVFMYSIVKGIHFQKMLYWYIYFSDPLYHNSVSIK